MASVTSSSRGRAPIVGINVTPMVDVMLVLLIIMMVAATYIVSQALKVELPRTATSDETVAKTYVVTVTREGNYLFNDKPVSHAGLVNELKAARKASKGEVNLVITADAAAQHGQVVGVIDTAKLEGITKFAINVERR
ncbi:MAG TPA: biopolymer transporter ExbD [Polyangiaceae bacterium]|nr:biopolymer transporter ExbD [Polyangiaceae bacterium]